MLIFAVHWLIVAFTCCLLFCLKSNQAWDKFLLDIFRVSRFHAKFLDFGIFSITVNSSTFIELLFRSIVIFRFVFPILRFHYRVSFMFLTILCIICFNLRFSGQIVENSAV